MPGEVELLLSPATRLKPKPDGPRRRNTSRSLEQFPASHSFVSRQSNVLRGLISSIVDDRRWTITLTCCCCCSRSWLSDMSDDQKDFRTFVTSLSNGLHGMFVFDKSKIIIRFLNRPDNDCRSSGADRSYRRLDVHQSITDFHSSVLIGDASWNDIRDEYAVIPREKSNLSGLNGFLSLPFDMLMGNSTCYRKAQMNIGWFRQFDFF